MKDNVSGAFREAEMLLRKYGCLHQADIVHAGFLAVQGEGDAGYSKLATLDWWGGAGSVADVYLHQEGETFTMGQEKDNRALRAALMTIQESMRAAGVVFERADAWAGILTQWRTDGI